MNRWLFHWRKLTRQLWVRATAYAGLGVGAALVAAWGAPFVPSEMAERLGNESVEEILTILASSLLAVATFSVGAMVTAYTSVSSSATPRVAALVTADERTQKALSTFVGAFLYAIVSVTAINAQYYGAGGRAILFLISLCVVGLVAFRLLAWINTLSRLARVGHMIERVETEARRALCQRAARPFLGGMEGRLEAGETILSLQTGYVQNVDPERLQALATEADCRVEVLAMPGTLVRRGEPLARVSLDRLDDDACRDWQGAFAVGESRSFDQDPRYGLIVLGEIAARALSPGINDPGTAIQVVAAGLRLLDEWEQARSDPDPVSCDRILAAPLDPADLLEDVLTTTARYGAGDVAVSVRLRKVLASLAANPGPFREPARRMARDQLERVRGGPSTRADRSQIEAVKV
ncbi:DUF2254 domain-containing protein [Brevundimonas sp.]|uniref:DUF2254 domain-containing protein n=1 Tax=Brevundimonas sp. TaxID=1871086 RepID=UPI003AF7841D